MQRLRYTLVWVPVLLLLMASMLMAQPQPDSAYYYEHSNTFELFFSGEIVVDAASFVISGILVDDDLGGPFPDHELRGGTLTAANTGDIAFHPWFGGVIGEYTYTPVQGNPEDREVWGLDYADLIGVEEDMDHTLFDHMRLYCPAGVVVSPSGQISEAGWVDLTYVEAESNQFVELTDAVYNAATNALTLDFNRIMQFDQIPEDLAEPHPDNPSWPGPGDGIMGGADNEDRNGNGVLDFEANVNVPMIRITDSAGGSVTLSSAMDMTRMDSETLDLELLPTERAAVENLDTESLMISFDRYAFVDVDYNPAQAVAGFPLEFVADSDPLVAETATYDMGLNLLKVKFNLPLGSNVRQYAVIPKLIFQRVTADSTYRYAFEAGFAGLANSDSTLTVTLGVGTSHTTEDMIDSDPDGPDGEFTLFVRANAVSSYLGNGNLETTEDPVPVEIIPEGSNKGPELDPDFPPYYNAETNELFLRFDVRLDEQFLFESIHLYTDTDTVTLSDGIVDRVGGNKAFSVILGMEDQYAIENTLDTDNLSLWIEPYCIRQSSKLNGNRVIRVPDENIAEFLYIPDASVPLLEYMWYDEVNGRLVVGTNGTVPAENIDLSAIVLSGVDFGTADSDEVSEPNRISFYLNSADVDEMNALSLESRPLLLVSADAGFLVNSDGVASAEIVELADGDTTYSDVDEAVLTLGYGREFWIRSQEAFPTLPRTVDASLRRISDGALWYVANDQWAPYQPFGIREGKSEEHPIVTALRPSELDSAVTFFEEHTRMLDEDGVRVLTEIGAKEAIDSLIAGSRADVLPERINILLADVWDEFGMGRNDSDKAFWKQGYFLSSDLPGNATDEYANESDLIIVDTYPQSFNTGDEAWTWNTNNEVWDAFEMDDLDESGFAALANLYTQFVSYKVDRFEEDWIKLGLAYFAEFYTFRNPEYYGSGVTTGLTGGNSLEFIGSDFNSRTDYKHVFMYFLYLWEKYGQDDFITAVSTSPYTGMSGVTDALNIRNEFLADWQKDNTVLDIYLDFATANIMDTTYTEDDHNRFMFESINTQAAIRGAPFRWKVNAGVNSPPYAKTCPEWGFNYFFTGYTPITLNPLLNPSEDNLIVFAGEGATDIAFRKLNLQNTELAGNLSSLPMATQDIELEGDLNIGTVPMSPGVSPDGTPGDWVFGGADDPDATFPTWFLITAGAGGDFLVHYENNPADYSRLFVSQNPVISSQVDLHIITERPLYRADGVASPTVGVYADEAQTEVVSIFDSPDIFEQTSFSNAMGQFEQYVAHVAVSEKGEFYWVLDGFYSNGVPIVQQDPTMVVMSTFEGGIGNSIRLSDGFRISATAYSFNQDTDLLIVRSPEVDQVKEGRFVHTNPDRSPVSNSYSLGMKVENTSDPITISLPYNVSMAGDLDVGIYLLRDGHWDYVGGDADQSSGMITARVGQLGSYMVMAGQLGEIPDDLVIPTEFELGQNYPNPFNPSTTIRVSLPQTSPLKLVVYDVLGREVVRLFDDVMPYGSHQFHFDGRSRSGMPIASGVYFLRMDASGYSETRKMVLVK